MPQLLTSPQKAFSIFAFIKKHWYIIVILLVTLPSLISSVRTAYHTNNPTYPLFVMGSKLLIADQTIDKEINQLREDPSKLIGMENPETGIWLHVVYYWKFFWNIIWELLGNIILIFFPLTLIYSIMSLIDKSKVAKNILISSLIFIIYLVLVNSIMLTHSALKGNSFITLPENLDIFHEYLFLSMKVLPFHGLINLATYLFKIIIIT